MSVIGKRKGLLMLAEHNKNKTKVVPPMPLVKGKSKKVIAKNIAEFHGGKTYAKTAAKFGKKKANAQAVAVAMNKAGKSRGK